MRALGTSTQRERSLATLEAPLEHVARARTVTKGVRHLACWVVVVESVFLVSASSTSGWAGYLRWLEMELYSCGAHHIGLA